MRSSPETRARWMRRRLLERPRRVVALVALAGPLAGPSFLPSRADAQEILDAVATGNGTCNAFSAQDDDSFVTFENIATQMCDATFSSGTRFAQALSRVGTLFYVEPIVDAFAFAEQVDGIQAQVIAASSAFLSYDADLEFVAAPPFVSPTWPLLLTAPWTMSDFDSEGSITGEVRLTVYDDDGAVFFSDVKVLGVDADEGQWVLQGESEVDAPFKIQIEATCSANPPDDGLSQCQAILDPWIEFDQATFDATHGASSFTLTDYLTIVRSPNLVPEPGPAVMLGVGVLGLVGLARRAASGATRSPTGRIDRAS